MSQHCQKDKEGDKEILGVVIKAQDHTQLCIVIVFKLEQRIVWTFHPE